MSSICKKELAKSSSERIDELFKEKKAQGISARSILLQLGMSETALAEWNRGKAHPTLDAIVKLAQFFNVSADYLLGLTDERRPLERHELEQAVTPIPSSPAVFDEMPDLLSEERFVNTAKIYHELPDELRERVYMLVYGMALGIGLNVNKIIGR